MKVLYEDNHVIVCFKEEGVLSQKDKSNTIDMLSLVKEHIKKKYNKPGNVYLGLVHRLDRNTSGVMVFAKTSKAASRLSEQIKNHNGFKKRYLAVCEGQMEIGERKRLENKLLKNSKENKSYVSNSKGAKEASLEYLVLDSKLINKKYYSLIDIKLNTGRHHQIRCQLSNINHPIAGDVKYGANINGGNSYNLSSYELVFNHPTLKEELKFKYFIPNHLFLKFCDKNNFLKRYNLD